MGTHWAAADGRCNLFPPGATVCRKYFSLLAREGDDAKVRTFDDAKGRTPEVWKGNCSAACIYMHGESEDVACRHCLAGASVQVFTYGILGMRSCLIAGWICLRKAWSISGASISAGFSTRPLLLASGCFAWMRLLSLVGLGVSPFCLIRAPRAVAAFSLL